MRRVVIGRTGEPGGVPRAFSLTSLICLFPLQAYGLNPHKGGRGTNDPYKVRAGQVESMGGKAGPSGGGGWQVAPSFADSSRHRDLLAPPAAPAAAPQEAVIEAIVGNVQGVPGDDRAVLMLGYEEEMQAMLRDANPGLKRRFQMEQAWRFEDYSQEDLLHIMRGAAKSRWGRGGSKVRGDARVVVL